MTPLTGETPEHALRNAINAAIMAAQVVRRHLQQGNNERALQFLDDVDESCERCRVLVEGTEPKTAIAEIRS